MTKYDQNFYDKIVKESYSSAQVILKKLFNLYKPNTVIDVGAGSGSWSVSALELGATKVIALDGSEHSGHLGEQAGITTHVVDFESHGALSSFETGDLLVCLEVAEHLSKNRAASFVSELCNQAPVVLFSAAIPYQGGTGHVNENWPEYWHQLFSKYGFRCFDNLRESVWGDPEVAWWYQQNTMLFVNPEKSPEICEHLKEFEVKKGEVLTKIHPEQFLVAVHRNNDTVNNNLGQDQYFYKESAKYKEPNVGFYYGNEFPS